VHNAISQEWIDSATAFVKKHRKYFRGIHSKQYTAFLDGEEGTSGGWTVAHLIIFLSKASQRKQTRTEQDVYKDMSTDEAARTEAAKIISGFADAIQKAAHSVGIPWRGLDNIEFIRSMPKSDGQHGHMDLWKALWNVLTPLRPKGNCPATVLYKYPGGYKPYPENMQMDSGIPDDWSTMETIVVHWKPGTLLFALSNLIHCGPSNNTRFYRDIVFGSELSPFGDNTFTTVVTNDMFNKARNIYRARLK
jgi:hypothetical protein